jgi:hypothetical protein
MSMTRGAAILTAGIVAGIVLPLATLGLGLPLWLSAVIAGGVFGGTWLVTRSAGPADGFDAEAVSDARSETSRALLAEAAPAMGRLAAAAKAIRDPGMRSQVQSLTDTGEKVIRGVKANPDRAMAVRRLLTFYLPNAASLAEGWRALEDRAKPTDERVTQTRDTMRALNQAFSQYADDLVEPQLQTLDLDLKVLNDALHSDLAQSPPAGSIGAHAP